MKKYLATIIISFSCLCGATTAFASMSFLPVSPSSDFSVVVASCTLGTNIAIYSGSSLTAYANCDGSTPAGSSLSSGIYNIVECDTTAIGATCSSDTTLDLAYMDSGFKSQTYYEVLPSSSPSGEYSTLYIALTSYFPQILLKIFFPMLLVGVALRFMRNPTRM
jgi:hypothetical protein